MIYIRVNKAASTSTSNYVKDHCTILQYATKRADRLGGWLDRERIKNEECFTVVRNPYTRSVSCWQHCIRLGFRYSFREWLEKDFALMKSNERAHSLPQFEYLRDSAYSIAWVDYVFKIEDPFFVSSLSKLIGVKKPFPREATGRYERYGMDEQERELVKQKYLIDFKTFRYKL